MSLPVVDQFLAGLMGRYRERVPAVGRVMQAMIAKGLIERETDIENDHIAFRTMGVPHLGIDSLEKIFLAHGFERRDRYEFPTKKLVAFWYSPPRHDLPRVFISELRVDALSDASQQTIRSYTDLVVDDPVNRLDLHDGQAIDAFLHQSLWRTPSWADYEQLAAESEYAAWVIYNRYYLNHFTISVHDLPPPFNTIAGFNEFAESAGLKLNDAGGKVKASADGLLIQSATVAEMVNAEFDEGPRGTVIRSIPGSYVEFAERRVRPEFGDVSSESLGRSHRRDGFEVGNADKIFESTYRHQTG